MYIYIYIYMYRERERYRCAHRGIGSCSMASLSE